MDKPEQKASRFWWIALGVVIGMLIGSPRLSVRIQQCDSDSTHEVRNG
jgi:hypothetical protein